MGEPTVTVIDSAGGAHEVPVALATKLPKGYRLEADADRVGRLTADVNKERYGGVAGGLAATGAAVARGFTGGGLDALLTAIGGEGARQQLEGLKNENPTLSTVGEIGGTVLPAVVTGGGSLATEGFGGLASRAGAKVAGTLGGESLAARVVGGATEGAVFGVGSGVSELALSRDPLTAEHVASVLSSNALLGGVVGGVVGAGSKLFERGLQIAGEKLGAARAARGAVEGLPADLQGLDEAGLREAHASAKAAHAADIQAERGSLESIRANQRAELANQVRDLHENLASERPIFAALSEDAGVGAKAAAPVSDASITMRPTEIPEGAPFVPHSRRTFDVTIERPGMAPEVRQIARGEMTDAAVNEHLPEGFRNTAEGIDPKQPWAVRRGIPATPAPNELYVVRPSELAARGVHGNEINPGNLEGVKGAWAEGKALHPIQIDMDASGKLFVEDGNHRLQAAALAGDKPVAVRFRQAGKDFAPQASARDIGARLGGAIPKGPSLKGLKGIPGVSDARVQLAKSYKSLRSALDSPLSVQRDPSALIRPLEQRQAALETLQGKLPELHATLAGDARATLLEHVDTALAETRQQIAAIRHLREAPITGHRLTALESGPSARMQAIDGARAALKAGPELGMIGKGASTAVFGGVTALAHMIPGVGIAAPFLGKAASEAVARLFQRGAATVGTAAEKASGAASKFLGAAKALEPYAAPTATKVLAAVRFGASKADEHHEDLGALFRARTAELYQQTQRLPDGTTVMRPEARAAMAAKLDPIRHVNPKLADQIETIQARKTCYLAQVAPKKPDPPALQIGPDTSRPGDLAIRAWARVVRAVEDPSSVEERLSRGVVTPEEAQAYRSVYPERFAALQHEIFSAAPLLEKTLPMSKKVALSVFTGIPVTPSMQPNVLAVLQATFAVEPGSAGGTQAPRPQPSFGALGSLRDVDKPTPAQAREGAGG